MINYVPSSIASDPRRLSVFLDWCELQGVTNLEQITSERVEQFFWELGKTKSKRTGKVLSLSSLRIYMTTLNRFGKCLRQSKQGSLVVSVKFIGGSKKRIQY